MHSEAGRNLVRFSSAEAARQGSRASGAPPLWPALVTLGVISTLINLLMLASVIFVVEVFREVIPNHNVTLLVWLLGIVVLAYLLVALLQLVQARFLRRFADTFDQTYERGTFRAAMAAAGAGRLVAAEMPARDLGRIRTFILDGALAGLFDLPWSFVFIGMMGFFHPLLGAVSLAFTAIAAALGITARHLSKGGRDANEKPSPYLRAILTEDGAVRAFGLAMPFEERWVEARGRRRDDHRHAQWLPDVFRSLARAAKMLHPIVILALAVYLALRNFADFGIIIATGILVRRISEPVDAVARGWPDISAARKAWPRLKRYRLPVASGPERSLPMPAVATIVVDGVTGGPPDHRGPVVPPVSFELRPGGSLGVTGPSGSGKSALAKILAGCWTAAAGKMLMGAVDRFELSHEHAVDFIGYVAQDSRFFDGSIAENISSFASARDEQLLLDAVRLAGLEDFVARVDGGLDAQMETIRLSLSRGLRQRLALARAIYRKPHLLILDDPTICLDQDGKRCLFGALKTHRERGGVMLICTNELPLLQLCDRILVLRPGQAPVMATRDEFLKPQEVDVTGVFEHPTAAAR